MPTTRLSRSIPYWVLVGGSVVTLAGGAYLLISKLTLMATTLTDGTATGVEVYAGQIWAVLGAILVGAGLIGLALALTLAGLRSAIPARETVDVIEPPAWDDVVEIPADEVEATAAEAAAEAPAAEAAADAATPPVTEDVAR